MGSDNTYNPTQLDEGWRQGSPAGSGATVLDEGWRLATTGRFKDKVEKLTELRSESNIIYKVTGTVSRMGGESVILRCEAPDGEDVAAKVFCESADGSYYSDSSRRMVLNYMQSEEGRLYTLAVFDTGYVTIEDTEYYFEIMPFCEGMDLSDDGAFSFDRIVEITRQLNEALYSIHRAGIVHRDIKPENLFEYEGRIRLGDFGIAKEGGQGRSRVTEHILGTAGYAAPETGKRVYSEKIDYYALGVTLASLFEGHYVFDNVEFANTALVQVGERIPLMRKDPHREQLENLVNGLCRFSPNQRFGYEDVEKWLANHDYTGDVIGDRWPRPFTLLEESYSDEKSMFDGITKDERHWDEAKKILFRKLMEPFFASFDPSLASTIRDIQEEYENGDQDKGLAVFLKCLYPGGPLVYRGDTFNRLSGLAMCMLGAEDITSFAGILQSRCVSHWLENTPGVSVDEETLRMVTGAEEMSGSDPHTACYWFGNSFAPVRSLDICCRNVSSLDELMDAMFSSPKSFYCDGGYDKLMSREYGAYLYGFLFSFGLGEAVGDYWEKIESLDTFAKFNMLLSMLDRIAVTSGCDPEPVRRFYRTYGPVGAALYTAKLVAGGVYEAFDTKGQKVLDDIAGFKSSASGSVDDLYRSCSSLFADIELMKGLLVDDPHIILTGVYHESGIITVNLIGCFAYEIFGTRVPLGFDSWIDKADEEMKYEDGR